MDRTIAWEDLKKALKAHSERLESKMNGVHHTWAKEFRDRLYEIDCVLATMDDLEGDRLTGKPARLDETVIGL